MRRGSAVPRSNRKLPPYDSPVMSGWQVKTSIPGLEPDTRPVVEVWAARIPDKKDAVSAVETLSGVAAVNIEVMCKLDDDVLAAFGLVEAGEVVRLQAIIP
jgi:hypothetical protein